MIKIVEGSILDHDGDAIVNAANSFMNHGAGLARVIKDAATAAIPLHDPERAIKVAKRETFGGHNYELVATGNVVVGGPGLLPFEGIIHAVGPVWNGGRFYERQLLDSAYHEAADAAVAHGWTNVGFPAISVGLFGFPSNHAARIAITALGPWDDDINVTIYLFDPNPARQAVLVHAFTTALEASK